MQSNCTYSSHSDVCWQNHKPETLYGQAIITIINYMQMHVTHSDVCWQRNFLRYNALANGAKDQNPKKNWNRWCTAICSHCNWDIRKHGRTLQLHGFLGYFWHLIGWRECKQTTITTMLTKMTQTLSLLTKHFIFCIEVVGLLCTTITLVLFSN